MLLAGLAVGLWPEAIHQSQAHRRGAPLPVLQAVAVAQCAYFLLVWPIILAFRSDSRHGAPRAGGAIAESALLLVVAIPFYVAAGYFADATVADLARTAVAVCGGLPLAWACGLWMATCCPARPAALAAALTLAVGGAAGYYVVGEFLGGGSAAAARVLWQISPITFAWSVAQSQAGHWLPRPLWPLAAWALIAAVAGLVNLVCVRQSLRNS